MALLYNIRAIESIKFSKESSYDAKILKILSILSRDSLKILC